MVLSEGSPVGLRPEGSFGCENLVLETIRKGVFFYFIKENRAK